MEGNATMKYTYTIYMGKNTEDLERKVTEAITAGWEPLGGVSVSVVQWESERKGCTETIETLYQAMVKKI